MNLKPAASLQAKAPTNAAPGFYVPAIVSKLSSDTFTAALGKPVEWLTPKQVANETGLNEDTICRYIKDKFLPKSIQLNDGKTQTLVRPRGKRGWHIHASALPLLREKFAALRDEP